MATNSLEDVKINIKIKLAGLWVSLVLCYIYGDYFGLYTPNTLEDIIAGKMGPLGNVTEGILVGVSVMMSIPSLMVFLSLVLKPKISRWLNIIFGIIYTLIMIITIPGSWFYYIYFGIIEIAITLAIVWYAWRWPKVAV